MALPFTYPTPEATDSPSSRDESRTRKHGDEKHASGSDDAHSQQSAPKRQRVIVQSGNLCYPASHYKGYQPRLPPTPEHQAINELAAIWNAADRPRDDCNIWELTDFTIYHKSDYFRHANELCPVHHLMAESGVNRLVFDGVISVDTEKRSVNGVSFDCLALEGYGDQSESSLVSACIQSPLGKRDNVWYHLKRPAREYTRYYDASRWVFQFTKYVVDFLECSERPVTLCLFRRQFYAHVNRVYQHSMFTKEWLRKHPSHDFGQAFCANLAFLIRECYSVNNQLLEQPIFGETDVQRLRAIPTEVSAYEKTVVTPFIFESFHKMPFNSQMQVLQDVDPTTYQRQLSRRNQLRLTPLGCRPTSIPPLQNTATARKIRKGDVISVFADTKSQWRGSRGTVWYAFVQEVREWKNGALKLDILWLYEPSDTTLGHGHYPYQNELFISDNCSCGEDAIDAKTVQSIVPVQWFVTDPGQLQGFFVRQKFRTEPMLGAYDFTQLQPSDFTCVCRHTETEMDKVAKEFGIGDTVLVYHQTKTTVMLEPAIIRGFTSRQITLQALLRCRRDLGNDRAPPNQLELADGTFEVGPESITRSCKVATFATITDVKSPYDRGGAGDYWFVVSSTKPTWNFKQETATSRLNGMGIFCGAGALDRGLEEGGGLEFKWGIDIAQHALHSYRANSREPEKLSLFLGSVDDYLAKAIQGSADHRIAAIGDVDVLAAGSPCPGFSVLQPDKNSIPSLRNCSLVASVCSYVDLFMPTYLVLENVIGMASAPKNAKELNVFSQVLCCLLLMDPGHYGSCQSRQRLFILATAPGHAPPESPPQTHACVDLSRTNAIGYASNGLPFGQRKHDVCPLPSLTAEEAFGDLPNIADGHVQTCVQAPDHRLCRYEDLRTRAIIQMVPRWPRGQGFMQAYAAGKMSKQAIADYRWANQNRGSKHSKSWSRLYPDRLVGCLTTMIKPHDLFTGRTLHWDQPRLMSVMEARRVQGLPDNEIVIGKPSHQWRQIGNGVDRKVAFALGLQIAKAHQKTVAAKDLQNGSFSQTELKSRQEVVAQLLPDASGSAIEDLTASDKEVAESTTHGGVVPRALFEVYTEAPSKGVFQKDGVEYIVID
ncbi:S-adenosyl-L-methionine-dependent methyltransferase [Aureobasidium subglaciale]|nr:S-adenosyl-L-methionine-dependent methyltransferase [Aureobasidium subglaciale]